jgi:hypothetical protein
MSTADQELQRCPVCGELRGLFHRHDTPPVLLACICEGIPCRRCGRMKIRRPGSNYIGEDGQVWRVPWFGFMERCAACRLEDAAAKLGRPPF